MEGDKGKDILVVLIVILVGCGSFGLGRLSKSSDSSGLKIEYSEGLSAGEANVLSALSVPEINSSGKNFFASNRGTKYYPAGCSAGNNLKQENRIYFNTREEAEGAGYELSSACR